MVNANQTLTKHTVAPLYHAAHKVSMSRSCSRS